MTAAARLWCCSISSLTEGHSHSQQCTRRAATRAAAAQGSGAYPIAPVPAQDPRFTLRLTTDVMDVLAKHGYRRPEGQSVIDLQEALFGFLYVGAR